MGATFPLRPLTSLLLILCFALPAAAGGITPEPVVVDGLTYATWSDYFQSDHFQSLGRRCGTQVTRAAEKLAGPGDCTASSTNPTAAYDPGNTYPLQVVVHILLNDSGSQGDISDAMVQSQIDILNEDFRALAGTPGAPGNDIAFQFALATTDPSGNPTNGITRSYNTNWFNDNGTYYNSLAWDPNSYINVYTNTAGGYLGYVPWIPQQGSVGSNADRVVIHYQSFGRNSPGAPYDQGRTLTHELGHYFGLLHTFDGGCGTVSGCYTTGDLICDTNREQTATFGCSDGNTCSSPDPIHNYMDYTDDTCMNNFTVEQNRRMRCSIENYRSGLLTLATSVANAMPVSGRPLLRAARPNPFNPTTELSFELPSAGRVRLSVVDVTGRLVRTLVNGPMSAGLHTATWDGVNEAGESVASGVYLYNLTSENGSETKRMVLMR